MAIRDMVPSNLKLLLGFGIAFLIAISVTSISEAHGTSIELTVNENRVDVHALFDTGEPMSNAQITVYAADNPREAWLSGEADEEGRYSFEVDNSISGAWGISVRTAGHGELLHFDVTRNGRIIIDQSTERTPLQTALMVVGVLAVLGGVAWFFSRSRRDAAASVG